MNISFENKKVLVTGAGRGIGKEIARAFAHYGACKVFALSKTKSRLDELAKEFPGVIVAVPVDLADWSMTREAVEKLGTIDILINNAGMGHARPFLEVTPEEIDTLMTINVKSIFNVSQVVITKMIAQGKGGAIVNVSSQASKIALMDHAVYSTTKASVDALTRQLALEFGKYNIRVNAVNPTVVMTEMARQFWSDPKISQPLLDRIPLHKFAEISDIVSSVIFLASDRAAMINAHTLPIEGGLLSVQ